MISASCMAVRVAPAKSTGFLAGGAWGGSRALILSAVSRSSCGSFHAKTGAGVGAHHALATTAENGHPVALGIGHSGQGLGHLEHVKRLAHLQKADLLADVVEDDGRTGHRCRMGTWPPRSAASDRPAL